MKRWMLLAAALAAVLSLAGCASVNVKPVDKYDRTTPGFRIPERKPLVVVLGGHVDVMWVCNPDKGTAMQFGSFLAKHHMVIDFNACGSPSKIDSEQDSTAIPLKLLEIVNAVAAKTLPGGQGVSGTTSSSAGSTPFQIFDVRFGDDSSVQLVPLVHSGDILRLNLAGEVTAPVVGVTGGGAG
jgi:opacity protein-like surface antigen